MVFLLEILLPPILLFVVPVAIDRERYPQTVCVCVSGGRGGWQIRLTLELSSMFSCNVPGSFPPIPPTQNTQGACPRLRERYNDLVLYTELFSLVRRADNSICAYSPCFGHCLNEASMSHSLYILLFTGNINKENIAIIKCVIELNC